jgi:hypothetical protein
VGNVVSGVVIADVLQSSSNGFNEVGLTNGGHGAESLKEEKTSTMSLPKPTVSGM